MRGACASEQGGLLGVEAVLGVAAAGAVNEQAGRGVGGGHGGVAGVAEQVAGGLVVLEREGEGVVDVGGVAVVADGGGDAGGWAEVGERLVDEVRAEVEEDAGGGAGILFPASGADVGAEPVEVGMDFYDAA